MPQRIRRLGLIGDIHGEDERLAQAIAYLQGRGVDAIAATGDVVDGLGDVDRCCELLGQHGVITVRGNHDRWLLAGIMRDLPHATMDVSPASRRFLAGLPGTTVLFTVAGALLLCHGMGSSDMARLGPDDDGYAIQFHTELQELIQDPSVQLVACGHMHQRFVRSFPGLVVMNPGTLFRDHAPGFYLVDFVEGTASGYDLAQPDAVREEPVQRWRQDLPV
ncbi:MAG TPA: metallophosphoesterase family protein [Haliangium sp.]|nr:metallophosphoesterase family protein [Haliangium sp.]